MFAVPFDTGTPMLEKIIKKFHNKSLSVDRNGTRFEPGTAIGTSKPEADGVFFIWNT